MDKKWQTFMDDLEKDPPDHETVKKLWNSCVWALAFAEARHYLQSKDWSIHTYELHRNGNPQRLKTWPDARAVLGAQWKDRAQKEDVLSLKCGCVLSRSKRDVGPIVIIPCDTPGHHVWRVVRLKATP